MAKGTVVAPGAFNALVARAVARAGFDACYVSGGAPANTAGYPDIGLITLTEMTRTVREIVDADTGYGEVEAVVRTTVEYERAGAAALHIEDQVFPKRCGHLEGKTLVDTQAMCEKVAAACEHRLDPDFVVIARTDARAVTGLADAIDRANAYRAAGADVIFPEGLESETEFEQFAAGSPGGLLANMTEFGKTPVIPADGFAALGYQLVIFPLSMLRLAMARVIIGLESLRKHGTVEGLLDDMQTRRDLYELLDYTSGRQWNFPSTKV